MLALLEGATIVVVSRLRVKLVATYAGLSGKIVFKICCGGYTDHCEHRNLRPGGVSALNIRVIMWKKNCASVETQILNTTGH